MSVTSKYVKKYILFRSVPHFALCSSEATALILMSAFGGSKTDLYLAIALSAIFFSILFIVSAIKIYHFVDAVKSQEKKYNVRLSDTNPRVISKHSPWIILSDEWLICPGKFAIYLKAIEKVALHEVYAEYKRQTIYPVHIKTKYGKKFILKISNDPNKVKLIQKWARLA